MNRSPPPTAPGPTPSHFCSQRAAVRAWSSGGTCPLSSPGLCWDLTSVGTGTVCSELTKPRSLGLDGLPSVPGARAAANLLLQGPEGVGWAVAARQWPTPNQQRGATTWLSIRNAPNL